MWLCVGGNARIKNAAQTKKDLGGAAPPVAPRKTKHQNPPTSLKAAQVSQHNTHKLCLSAAIACNNSASAESFSFPRLNGMTDGATRIAAMRIPVFSRIRSVLASRKAELLIQSRRSRP